MVTQSWYVLVCLGDLSRAFLSEVRINMSLSDEHENHEQALASESSELFFFFSGKSEEFFYVFSHHKVWVFSVMEGAEPEPYLQECGARELRIMSLPTTLII